MSMLIRTAQLRAAARPALRFQARSLHIENTAGTAIPGGTRSLGFKLRFWTYATVGFTLPFIATEISQRKAAGSS